MTNIRKLQDIQVGNEELLNTYRNYFSNGYINAAHNLINTNTLKSYVLQAEWMNAIKTKIENIEEPKDIEIDQELANKNAEFQYNIDELCYLQQYRTDVQYYKNNFVLYNNMVYFCIKNCKGIPPTFSLYWVNIGLIGKKGQYGLGVTYRGFWDENTSYNKYDLISYQNNLYIARNDNTGSIPNQYEKYLNDDLYLNNTLHLGYIETNQNWLLLTRVRPQPIYIFPSDYTQLPAHSIFFKELSYSIPSSPVFISGNIISINNALSSPVVDLTVGIESVQDLHGYDHPWPAGGGKNLLKPPDTGATINGVTFTVNSDGTINANGTATAPNNTDFYFVGGASTYDNINIPSGEYILTGCKTVATTGRFYVIPQGESPITQEDNSSVTITIDSTKKYRMFIRVMSGQIVSNQKYEMMIRPSSVADTTYQPYSNICPISGWTGMNVQRTGKNLFDDSGANNGYLDVNGNVISNTGWKYTDYLRITGGTTYTFTSGSAAGVSPRTIIYDQNKNILTAINTGNRTFTTDQNAYYIRISYRTTDTNIQFELGSTATSYEPYQGTTYPISWSTQAGTVYGGSLDVTTGVLTVDWRSVALTGAEAEGWRIGNTGTSNWYYITANGILTALNKNNSDNIKTNLYPWANVINASVDNGFWGSVANGAFRVRWGTEDTIANWKSFLASNPLYVVYKTSEPITYQLTPTEVTTLFRNNNLWADTGNIELTYLANIKA